MHAQPGYLVLFILAAICLFLAAWSVGIKVGTRVINLTALGLLFWVLVPLIELART
jgi:hypothetical protein